jgi:hypothetical protein
MAASNDFSINQSDAASNSEDASMKEVHLSTTPLSFEGGNLALLAQDCCRGSRASRGLQIRFDLGYVLYMFDASAPE